MKKIGLIGCGHISETYIRSQKYFNNIDIIACADLNEEASQKCSVENNILKKNVDEILADKEIEIILNLTNPVSHFEIIKKTLKSGKHSYCEKPFSIKFEQGRELIELAKSKNLYLGAAPDTFLGGGGQLTKKIIDSNEMGEIKLGNFIFAFPGVESFHPNPEPWFIEGGGPIMDMGPYFYTMLVNFFGPIKNVFAKATKVKQYRQIKTGAKQNKEFKVEIPTSYLINLEFNESILVQGFMSFDVMNHKRNHMEFYGTKGSIIGPDPNMFGGPIFTSLQEGGKWIELSTENMHLGRTNIHSQSSRSNESATNANYRGAGLSEMIYCIENNKEHKCNGNLALHVLDLLELTINSANSETKLEARTTCEKPSRFLENEIKKLMKSV